MPIGSMPMRPWFEKPLVDSTIGFGTFGAIPVLDQVPFGIVLGALAHSYRVKEVLRETCSSWTRWTFELET